jgi:hypothetical protein
MAEVFHDEKREIFIYLIFLLLSTSLLCYSSDSSFVIGLLGMLWGLYGIFRLAYINKTEAPRGNGILDLPGKILFSLNTEQSRQKKEILFNFQKPDVGIWLVYGFLFIAWGIWCTLFPGDIDQVKSLTINQEKVLDTDSLSFSRFYYTMQTLSYFGIAGSMVFVALSLAPKLDLERQIIYSLLAILLAGFVFVQMLIPLAQPFTLPGLNMPVGGGFGTAAMMTALAPETFFISRSSLWTRYVEMGWIGAYGAYILYAPPVYVFLKNLKRKEVSIVAMIGLFAMAVTLMLDMFWIGLPVVKGLIVLGLALSALCWDACRIGGRT